MRRALAAVAAIGAAVLPACSDTCELAECAEPLRFELTSRCWPDGTYLLTGTLDDEAFELPVTLPTPSGVASTADGRVSVVVSNERGLEAVVVQGTPASATLQIRLGDITVGSQAYGPIAYQTRETSGDCPSDHCSYARIGWTADEAAVASLCAVPAGGGAP